MAKCGFVAIVGRPNAGKSTLLNALLEERIAMVSHKAQATRKRLNAIVMHGEDQIVFVDTPGIHEREKELNKFMLAEAVRAIGDCDLVLFLADAKDKIEDYEKFLELSEGRAHLVVLNKIDRLSNEEQLRAIEKYAPHQERFLELVSVSASKGVGLKELLEVIVRHLPEGPYYYDPEMLTTETVKEIYKEMVREALFNGVSDEIPYESDVIIEKIDEKPNLDRVFATIVVEKDSQKGIVIGQKGAAIKRIGKSAREEMERFSQKKIYLELHVKVRQGWSKNKKFLEELGYVE